MSVTQATLSGRTYTDGLLSGPKWSGTSLTFSFPTAGNQFTGYSGGEPVTNFAALGPQQQDAVRSVLDQVSSFTNLSFSEIVGGGAGSAVLRFGLTDDTETAHAYLPSTHELGGDAWFNNSSGAYTATEVGDYAYFTFMHEIGHTLGLGHPHEADGFGPTMPSDRDFIAYTVMSYSSYQGASKDGYVNDHGSFPQTFMMEDIAALQHLYGANFGHNSSDTVYRWDPATGQMFVNGAGQGAPVANVILMTVWDGGGTDTYDFSAYATGGTIDLRPGEWTSLYSNQSALTGGYVPGMIANALLYQGNPQSLIENAIGTSAADTIYGNQAANALWGGAGSDSLFGDIGADILRGGLDDDVLFGGGDADRLYGDNGRDALHGEAGADKLFGGAGEDSLLGGDGDDLLSGEDDGDGLWGDLGRDILRGGGGNDTLDGGAGDDRLEGGDGDDNIAGGDDNDRIEGGLGNDRIDGGTGADVMVGGLGDDSYVLDHVGDVVVENLGEGRDQVSTYFDYILPDSIEDASLRGTARILTGNALNNILIGNGEDNVFDGGAGADEMYGGGGGDIYYVDRASDVVFDRGNAEGWDVVYSSADFAIVDGLSDPGYDPYGGASLPRDENFADRWINAIEVVNLTGSANISATGNDIDNILNGNSGNNVLFGNGGNDTLVGNAGRDTLNGGGGRDILDGGAGGDWMTGGAGNDIYLVHEGRDEIFEEEAGGTDTIRSYTGYVTVAANVENLLLMGGGIVGYGNKLANDMTGNGVANLLFGYAGDDILKGGDGADILNGGPGSNTLYGGAGNDVFHIRSAADTAIEYAGEGDDMVVSLVDYVLPEHIENIVLQREASSATGNALDNSIYGSANADTLVAGAGRDRLFGYDGNDEMHGDEGDDLIVGMNGDDRLFGGEGADRILGASGHDHIEGGSGTNRLYGGEGNDFLSGEGRLYGEAGNDVLQFSDATAWGGAGTDRFALEAGTSHAWIRDFSAIDDLIDLSAIDAIASSGADNAFAFIGQAAFSGAAGQLRYYQAGKNTYVEGDSNGDGLGDFLIQLSGNHSLAADDFVL